MTRTFDRLSRELRRRVMLMVGRAVLTVVNDATKLQTVQVEGLPGEIIDACRAVPAFTASRPIRSPAPTRSCSSIGGIRQHPVVMVDDRRYRVTGPGGRRGVHLHGGG